MYDEYTGEQLDATLVEKAKSEELSYFKTKNVWKVVPRAQASGRRVVGTRCVSCNKGDTEHPEIRCRLVCQEVQTYQSEEFFAATPPIESLRMILSLAAEKNERQVFLVDISRAHFNAPIGREVFVELPSEAGLARGVVGRLVKCIYGTRDAVHGVGEHLPSSPGNPWFLEGSREPMLFQS